MFNDEIWNVFLDYPHHMVTDHLENNIITHLKDFVSDFMDEKTIDDWIQNNLDDSLKELKLKRSYMTFMKTIEDKSRVVAI